MSREFIWGTDVDQERTAFRVVVEDGVCLTYEDDVLTNRLPYTVPSDPKAMWIDEVIEVWGKRCRFQLDQGVPYLQMDGKWTASDTTMDERMRKIAKNQKLAGLVQAAIGLVMCLLCALIWVVKGDVGQWWFSIVIGTFMIAVGLLQYYSVKKNLDT